MKKKTLKALIGLAMLSMSLSACSMLPGGLGGDSQSQGGGNQSEQSFTRGASMHTGRGRPSNDLGEVGDLYLDLSTYELYLKTESGWTDNGSLKGEKGDKGDQGEQGEKGDKGDQGEKGEDGQDGQDAVSNDTGLVFYALNEYEYAVGAGTAKLLEGEIVVPDVFNDKAVTAIAAEGFKDSSLTSLVLPETIRVINESAFEGCNNLQSLVVPNGLTNIAKRAFARCQALETVNLGGVNVIGEYAFAECPSLRAITLPASLRSIGNGAFYDCSMLSSVTFAGTQANWESISVGQYWFVGTRIKNITCSDATFNVNQYNEDILSNMESAYHLVGGYERSWIPNNGNRMTATSIKAVYNMDRRLGAVLSEKDIQYLYTYQFSVNENDANGTVNTVFNNKLREVSSAYSFRVSVSSYLADKERYDETSCIPNTNNYDYNSRAEALTSNIFIPTYQSSEDEKGFSWNNVPVFNVRPGTYKFVFAKYNSSRNGAQYGFGLIVVSGGDMIINDPLDNVEIEDPNAALVGIYLNEDGTEFARTTANNVDDLVNYRTKIPTKPSFEDLQYGFKEWEYIGVEGNEFTFRPIFESCTRNLVFQDNMVYQYGGQTKDVVIPSVWGGKQITRISDRCFQGKDITSVKIPDSVTYIDSQAFESCKKLTTIIIPNSVTNMGGSVFRNCTSLTSVTLSNQLTSIPSSIFQECTALENFNFPERCTSIGSYAFQNCTKLTSVVIPDTVTYISYNAFCNCSNLTDVVFGESLKSIESGVFSGCGKLVNVTFNDAITSIGSSAFSGCAFTSVVIPDTITYVGNYAFDNADLVIYMKGEFEPKNFDQNWFGNSTIIRGYVETIEVDGFTYILSEIEDHKYAHLMDFDASSIVNFVAPAEVNGYTLTKINLKPFRNNKVLETLDLSNADGITTINDNAFYGCTSLRSVSLPDSIESIGHAAFYGCISLETINVPDSTYYFGNQAFYGCKNLEEINIPEGVEYIYDSTFYNCSSLQEVELPDSLIRIYYSAFYGCRSLRSVSFGDGLIEIRDDAFNSCYSLTSVVIPDSVTYISYNAFNSCYSLKTVVLSNNLESIYDSAFANCRSLSSIVIPDSVTSIRYGAFNNCYSLTSITLGTGLIEIVGTPFSQCYSLVEVINKSSLPVAFGSETQGRVAYYAKQVIKDASKSKLSTDNNGFITYTDDNEVLLVGYIGEQKNISIPNNVTRINRYAFFRHDNIETVAIPNSVTTIDEYAFQQCYSLKKVEFGTGVAEIKNYAFGDCYSLYSITINGSTNAAQYSAFAWCYSLVEIINKSSSPDVNYEYHRNTDNLYYIITDESQSKLVIDENGCVTYEANNEIILLAYVGDSSTVIIPNNVTRINIGVFYNNRNIETVVLPTSVQNINESAFYNVENLSRVYYAGSMESWATVNVNGNNTSLGSCMYYYSVDEPEYIGNFWHYVNNVITVW